MSVDKLCGLEKHFENTLKISMDELWGLEKHFESSLKIVGEKKGTMIRLFKVKEKKRKNVENDDGGVPIKKRSAWELRLYKDFCELNLPKTTAIVFPNGKDDLMHFDFFIWADEGYYSGGLFLFNFEMSPVYPHEAPKVKCKGKVYHPNIDLKGNVHLNILHGGWKPVLSINTIIHKLHHLFLQPNHENPLNHGAAAVLRDNPEMFACNVRRAMAGDHVGEFYYSRCIDLSLHSELLSALKDPKAVILL